MLFVALTKWGHIMWFLLFQFVPIFFTIYHTGNVCLSDHKMHIFVYFVFYLLIILNLQVMFDISLSISKKQ